jgi:hypothetical protein
VKEDTGGDRWFQLSCRRKEEEKEREARCAGRNAPVNQLRCPPLYIPLSWTPLTAVQELSRNETEGGEGKEESCAQVLALWSADGESKQGREQDNGNGLLVCSRGRLIFLSSSSDPATNWRLERSSFLPLTDSTERKKRKPFASFSV